MLWLAAFGLAAAPACAEVNQQHATGAWHTADQCAKDAFKKYPDYTADSNAKREALRRECVRNHKLPDAEGG